jgi:hypothetical protein
VRVEVLKAVKMAALFVCVVTPFPKDEGSPFLRNVATNL